MKDLQKEVKEVMKEQEANKDITLSITVNSNGVMSWTIPQDLVITSHLLKNLEVIINKLYTNELSRMLEAKKGGIILP